jgi:3-hydroxybutyryl-CoA dehydratase
LPKASFNDFEMGDSYSKKFLITEDMVYNYAALLGDKNPIHLDSSYAKNTIFGKRICHGTLLTGLVSTVLGMNFPGEGTILIEINSKFLSPVFIDEEVEIHLEIIEKDTSRNNFKLNISCMNSLNLKVFEGITKVKFNK